MWKLILHKLSAGDYVHKYSKSIVVEFVGKRKVLSTSALNGGYREDVICVFNHDDNPGMGIECNMKAPTHKEHLKMIAEELGLNPEKTVGIDTAASMDNLSFKVEKCGELTVTAIVTAGVSVNGGRVGDPASFCETRESFVKINSGTINIILFIDADLHEGTMERVLVTCTEAKTAALQELMAGSNYSHGLATGSGTDGCIVICNAESNIRLTNAGKHSKLGELIGVSVKSAVKEALFFQSGLSADYQHSVLKRLKRFGTDEEKLWLQYVENKGEKEKGLSKAEFINNVHLIDRKGAVVVPVSLYVHLIDQFDWGLLSSKEVSEHGRMILKNMSNNLGLSNIYVERRWSSGTGETIEEMVDYVETVFSIVCASVKNDNELI